MTGVQTCALPILLTERVRRAVDRGCTVGHTLDKGAAIRLHLLDDED